MAKRELIFKEDGQGEFIHCKGGDGHSDGSDDASYASNRDQSSDIETWVEVELSLGTRMVEGGKSGTRLARYIRRPPRRKGQKLRERKGVITNAVLEYAQVVKMLGNGRLEAKCQDGETRLGQIRGQMRKKVSPCSQSESSPFLSFLLSQSQSSTSL